MGEGDRRRRRSWLVRTKDKTNMWEGGSTRGATRLARPRCRRSDFSGRGSGGFKRLQLVRELLICHRSLHPFAGRVKLHHVANGSPQVITLVGIMEDALVGWQRATGVACEGRSSILLLVFASVIMDDRRLDYSGSVDSTERAVEAISTISSSGVKGRG